MRERGPPLASLGLLTFQYTALVADTVVSGLRCVIVDRTRSDCLILQSWALASGELATEDEDEMEQSLLPTFRGLRPEHLRSRERGGYSQGESCL